MSQKIFQKILEEILQNLEIKQDFLNISSHHTLPIDEQALFVKFFDLLKTNVSPHKQWPGQFIGFFGPLGVGKTTLAAALTNHLGAQCIIKEPYLANPFWKHSQTDPSYMLRSQIYFLLSNIAADIKALQNPGIAISDTSTLTDIVMWAQWYSDIGYLQPEEYTLYKRLVKILKPSIPRPKLLITLMPDSVEHLYEGIRKRQQIEPAREGELVFTQEDLSAQVDRVKKAAKHITDTWETNVVTLTINPLTIYTDVLTQQDVVMFIQEKTLNR